MSKCRLSTEEATALSYMDGWELKVLWNDEWFPARFGKLTSSGIKMNFADGSHSSCLIYFHDMLEQVQRVKRLVQCIYLNHCLSSSPVALIGCFSSSYSRISPPSSPQPQIPSPYATETSSRSTKQRNNGCTLMGEKLWTNPEGEKAVICLGDGCSCKGNKARPVQRVDGKTGEVLEEYCSVKVASVHLSSASSNGITAVCRGRQRSVRGHVFQYKFQHHCNSNGTSKPVVQLDENDNIIAEFDSATEASKIHGVTNTTIGKICNGRRQQTRDGLRFKYKYDGDQVGRASTKRKRRRTRRTRRKITRKKRKTIWKLFHLSVRDMDARASEKKVQRGPCNVWMRKQEKYWRSIAL